MAAVWPVPVGKKVGDPGFVPDVNQLYENVNELDRRAVLITPETYGAVGNGSTDDHLALQAALNAAARGGCVVLSRDYATSQTLRLPPGARLLGPAGFKRATTDPAAFQGGVLRPHATIAPGSALLQLGEASGTDNPHGATVDGIAFVGLTTSGSRPSGLVGVLCQDTLDVRIVNSYIGEFDRPGNAGRGLIVEGSVSGSAYGATVHNCIVSACFEGLLFTGAGVTDIRISDTLVTGCTRGLSLGFDDRSGSEVNLGGGGVQMVNSHLTYTGMPSGGWHLRLGAQAGDCVFSNIYFDQHGNTYAVRAGNSNNILVACHFLPAPTCAREGLIRVTTAGTQRLSVQGCNVNRNGSAVESLVWYSAKAGTPTGGVVLGNTVYGTGSGWRAHAIDSGKTTITDPEDGTFVCTANSYTA